MRRDDAKSEERGRRAHGVKATVANSGERVAPLKEVSAQEIFSGGVRRESVRRAIDGSK